MSDALQFLLSIIDNIKKLPDTDNNQKAVLSLVEDILKAEDGAELCDGFINFFEQADDNAKDILLAAFKAALISIDKEKLTDQMLSLRFSYTLVSAVYAMFRAENEEMLGAFALSICEILQKFGIDPVEIIPYIVPAKHNYDKSKASKLDLFTAAVITEIIMMYNTLKKHQDNPATAHKVDRIISNALTILSQAMNQDPKNFFSPN